MLLEIAIGDAYGAGFEYADENLHLNTVSGYVKHPRHALAVGRYTDDTQMSIAIVEAMLSGDPWTPAMLAERFVGCFKRDAREGYAQSFYNFLCEVRDGEDFRARMRPESDKSGAAMRATPIGLLPNLADVIDKCTLQAKLTHDTPDGISAAVAAAVATHYLAYGLGPKSQIAGFVTAHVSGEWESLWVGRVKSQGWMSVRAALIVLRRNDTMSGILQDAISFGGDVDTVAAIAMGAACCSAEIVPDIPAVLTENLEDHAFGKRYLADLDVQLAKAFPTLRIINKVLR